MAAGRALARQQVDEIISRSIHGDSAETIATSMGVSASVVYSKIAKWRRSNGMRSLQSERRIPEQTQRLIVDMHRAGSLNREIASTLELSESAIEKFLRRYREATGTKTRYQEARDRIDHIGRIYTDHDGEITTDEIIEIAEREVPRPDGPWTRKRVLDALHQWRHRMGIIAPCRERQHLWDVIHLHFSTGFNAESIAAWLNENNLGLVRGNPWTATAVRVFHSDYAKRNDVSLSSMRTDDEVLEVAYRCALLRADSDHWTVVDMVDLFNEERYRFPASGRPWTCATIYNLITRANGIIRSIESYTELLDSIERNDKESALNKAIDTDDQPGPKPKPKRPAIEPTVEMIPDETKIERLKTVAYRILVLRDEGATGVEIRSILDTEFPRQDGWRSDHVKAVEDYGKMAGVYEPPSRDLSDACDVIEKLSHSLTHRDIVEHLNSEQIQNDVRPGTPWLYRHVAKVLKLIQKRRARQALNRGDKSDAFGVPLSAANDAPTKMEQTLGRRQLRRSEQLIREEARKKLAMRETAFKRANELHAQMQRVKEQLADAQFTLSEIDDAEKLLIQTGPPILQAKLATLNSETRNGEFEAHAKEAERIKQRVISEDWR